MTIQNKTPWLARLSDLKPATHNNNGFASAYSQDRARIIHSASFRRLQAKTQVLGLGDSDFYRTRLTHSMEVAQIGSGICEGLKNKYYKQDYEQFIPDLHLIESICLAHDLGHPAFGHGGEIALNYCMKDSGGFEGNGQTLRIATKLGEFHDHYGLNLTRRTLLGLIKYPAVYSNVYNLEINNFLSLDNINIDAYKPPKCIHAEETEILNWILEPFSHQDKQTFQDILYCSIQYDVKQDNRSEIKHHKTKYKAFDTSIMELADDIAYGIHDLEDAIALNLVTKQLWQDKIQILLDEKITLENLTTLNINNINELTNMLFEPGKKPRKHAISKLVRLMVTGIYITENTNFQNELLRLQATLPTNLKDILNGLKAFVYETVIQAPEVQLLEYKGQLIVLKLFETLKNNPSRLLPKNIYDLYVQEDFSNRVICDYIAGMTDNYATKLYQKLFIPTVGSVFDRL